VATKELKIGLVGATGIVGQAFVNILNNNAKLKVAELRLFASEASKGKKINCQSKDWEVQVLADGCFKGLDLVFFSSGDDISKEWGPKAVRDGAYVVDNSAAFRMDPEISLVVPEVNGHLLKPGMKPQIIANPNCTTIQLVVALKPLAEKFGITEVRVASYQAASGAGGPGHDELIAHAKDYKNNPEIKYKEFVHPLLMNVIPQIGSFNDQGFTSEEMKVMKETKKILGLNDIKVSAFTVRVPVPVGHSEAVWVSLKKKVSRDEVLNALSSGEGIVIQDNPSKSEYPMPKNAAGKDPVYVGRIHRDMDDEHLWLMWVVADNVRKGAALNGYQIAERLYQ
jgi:aspartate-semialdehyde dehydrogenase